jgi:hypothetical protein
MPTPVNHLMMAQEMRTSDGLSHVSLHLIEGAWGAFLLGSTGPDVQTVNRRSRRDTHFYDIPPRDDTPAHQALLTSQPELAQADRLAPDHAVFVAGYLAHLLADEAWWRQVFNPFFGVDAEWGEWRERIFLHNVLRTYLDREDQARLKDGMGAALAQADPRGWLPFVPDEILRAWRDLLVAQLQPGHHVRTAEVFAARMRVPAQAVEEALNSPAQMARIFRHVPPEQLNSYRSQVLGRSIELINAYLGGTL